MSSTRFRGVRPPAGAGGLALALLLALGACGDRQEPLAPGAAPRANAGRGNGPPFTVSISSHRATLLVGQSVQLQAALMNPGADTVFARGDLAWSSSDTSVLQVDATGLVKAVGPGAATVTAKFVKWDRAGTTAITSLAATLRNAAMLKGMWIGVTMQNFDGWFPGNAPYVQAMNREFSGLFPMQFAIGNLRWGWPNSWNFWTVDPIVPNVLSQGQMMRGGIIQGWLDPPFLQALQPSDVSRDSAIHLLTTHVDSVVRHFRGTVTHWDVVFQALSDDGGGHKPPSEAVWERLIGHDWIEIAYRAAAQADPDARLYYSDWNLENPWGKQDSAYALIAGMQAKGIRVNGIVIGAGGTSGEWMVSPAVLAASVARFGTLGIRVDLDLSVTFPPGTSPTPAQLAQQAAEYLQFVRVCDEAPNCDTVWLPGVDDGHIFWPPGSAATLLDASFQKKPAWFAIYNYLAGD